MDMKTEKKTAVSTSGTGIYLRGIVISNSARKITSKKDGSVYVIVRHEVAIDPGLAILERFLKLGEDVGIQVEGDEVKAFPKLESFKPVHAKVSRFRMDGDHFSAKEWSLID